ncbi:MAG: carbohydrate ABC transporter permease [Candidatus Latescibacterota bacterium]
MGKAWLRLAESSDLLGDSHTTGAYYLRLEGDEPTQLVEWLGDDVVTAIDRAGSARFGALPLRWLEAEARQAIVVAKMVRRVGTGTEELLFVAPPEGGSMAGECEILRNVAHQEVRRLAPRWNNYPETLAGPEASFGGKSTGFLLFMRNSFFISTMAVLGQVLSCCLVAFAFARLQFHFRGGLFVILLATMMIPGQVTLIPLFSIYKWLGWIDTFLLFIVPHFLAGAFNVFLLRQYMLTLPRELDESAAIDGCGTFRTYWHVILPNCGPVLIVVGLFTFIGTWQDVMGSLIYLDNPAYRTVTLGLEYFRSTIGTC